MHVFTSVLPDVAGLAAGVDWFTVVKMAAFVVLAILAVGAVFRAIFGKGSALNCAVSAVLSIFLVYLTVILLYVFAPSLRQSLSQLPFLTVTQERFMIWDVGALSGELLYPGLLKLAILAFVVNVMETFLPEGEKFISWYFWRMVTVLGSLAAYILVCNVVSAFLPQLFDGWAKIVILGFWAVIALTGIVKLLLAVVLTVVNPIIGGLYAFFFGHILGKQFTKSILTTVLVYAVFALLNSFGLTQFAFADFTLATYGPACVIVVFVLYLFGKLL